MAILKVSIWYIISLCLFFSPSNSKEIHINSIDLNNGDVATMIAKRSSKGFDLYKISGGRYEKFCAVHKDKKSRYKFLVAPKGKKPEPLNLESRSPDLIKAKETNINALTLAADGFTLTYDGTAHYLRHYSMNKLYVFYPAQSRASVIRRFNTSAKKYYADISRSRASIEFRLAENKYSRGLTKVKNSDLKQLYLHKTVLLSNAHIKSFRGEFSVYEPSLYIHLTPQGRLKLAGLSKQKKGKTLAIVINNEIIETATLREPLTGEGIKLSGNLKWDRIQQIIGMLKKR
ncbi:MAG: hypothetical protein GY754_13195 [bacterium]|nr:hypothetical protein [bacterium]